MRNISFIILSLISNIYSIAICQIANKEIAYLNILPEKIYFADTISLVLTSNIEEILYFSVSLEEKTGNQWIPVIDDIFRTKDENVINVKVLHPEEAKPISILLKNLSSNIFPLYGLCRFRIDIKDTPFTTLTTIFSNEFLIEYPIQEEK